MKGFRKILAIGAVAASALCGAQSFAATQGTLGATSTGTSDVSLSIASQFRISNIGDFAFGAYGGTGALTSNDDVCVYTNAASGAYKVRVTDSSSMSAAGFSVQNAGATAQIPFTVSWNGAIGTAGNQAVTYNTPLSSTGANTVSSDCSTGGLSANVQVSLAQVDLQAAPAGAYNSTITLVIEP